MEHIRLTAALSDTEVERTCKGRLCTPRDHEIALPEGSAAIYKPSGELLVSVIRGAVPEPMRAGTLPSLRALKAYKTDNRGVYTAANRPTLVREDGTRRKNTKTRDDSGKVVQVSSALIGYFDRQGGRHPFCRTTRFTANEVERWQQIVPLIEFVDAEFFRELRTRYQRQRNFVRQIRPEWRIGDTVFTTLTVNNNTVAGVHKDKGDFKEGFGVITCHRSGEYTGGVLCFPQYRVGVDLRDGDVLFFNSHDWHGMTPIVGEPGYERITCVYYARTRMTECGTVEEELARARMVRGSL